MCAVILSMQLLKASYISKVQRVQLESYISSDHLISILYKSHKSRRHSNPPT